MEVRVKILRRDVERFLRYHWWVRHRRRVLRAWAATAVLPAAILWTSRALGAAAPLSLSTYAWVTLAALAIFPLFVLISIQNQARRRFREKTRSGMDEFRLVLHPHHVLLREAGREDTLRPEDLVALVEAKDAAYLYTRPLGAIIIPRASFPGDGEFAEFIRLLRHPESARPDARPLARSF